jgi:Leucine-rich repeat (LRR) protein
VDIAEYKNLTTLHLDNNSITELPSEAVLESHTALTSLRVPANELRGSLNTMRLPRQLVELVLSHNHLSGPISIADLPHGIATFDIAFNEFSGPVDLTAFRAALRFAFLQHNRFTGRYDVTRLPLLSVKIVFGENDWDSLLPVVTDEELAEGDL